jgi:type IV pilus assembly protein PilV
MLNPTKGFSLLEALVALAITSIALTGLGSLQIEANKSATDAGGKSQGIWILEDLANRMRFNNTAIASYDTAANPINCGNAPKVCASYNTGVARLTADPTCTTAELAAFDLWELQCGVGAAVPGSLTTRASSVDFMPNPQLSVTVNGQQVTATVSWESTTERQDANGNRIYASNSPVTTVTRRASATSVFVP